MKTNEYLKYLRIKKGYSCRELSRISGISHTSICDLETGLYHPSLMTVLKLCEGLNEDIFDFLSITDYFKEEKIKVGKGEIITVDGTKIIVDFDNGIEEFKLNPEVIYVKSKNNNYIIHKIEEVKR